MFIPIWVAYFSDGWHNHQLVTSNILGRNWPLRFVHVMCLPPRNCRVRSLKIMSFSMFFCCCGCGGENTSKRNPHYITIHRWLSVESRMSSFCCEMMTYTYTVATMEYIEFLYNSIVLLGMIPFQYIYIL